MQTDPRVLLAMYSSISATVAAILAAVLGIFNRKKLHSVGLQVDGRLTEPLELTRTASRAEGAKDEKEKKEK
jgi:hypothetical protein